MSAPLSARSATDPNAWPRRLVTLGLITAIVGSSAPIPLYPIFRQALQLDASTMTLIFVAYVGGALIALLTMGQLLSRLANPYRLLVPSLLVVALGAALMAIAGDLGTLLAGRVLAGLGTGGVTVAANVVLIELSPQRSPRHAALLASLSFGIGSGLGPVLTGAALQLDWWPTVLPFIVIAASALISLYSAGRRWNSREGTAVRPAAAGPTGGAERSPIPWKGFLLCAAGIMSAWSMGSMMMALAAFFGDTIFGFSNYALSGLVVSGYLATTTLSQWLHRQLPQRPTFARGCFIAAASLLLLALAAHWQLLWLAALAMLTTGIGNGAAFGAAAGLLNHIAPPHHGARLVSWFYTAGYSVSLIPLLIGILIDHSGSMVGLNTYIACVTALLLFTGLSVRRAALAS